MRTNIQDTEEYSYLCCTFILNDAVSIPPISVENFTNQFGKSEYISPLPTSKKKPFKREKMHTFKRTNQKLTNKKKSLWKSLKNQGYSTNKNNIVLV